VRAFNEDLGINITRNLGSVKLYGVDAEVAYKPIKPLTLYASAAYVHSEVQNDVKLDALRALPTKGKELVETPRYTLFWRGEYELSAFTLGIQGKYVGKRFSTDVNDETTPAYTVWDLDIRYDMAQVGLPKAYLQLNVTNLADEKYFGSISSGTNTNPIITPGGVIASALPFYQIGSPRAVSLSVHAEF
jgi:iron complex outermembrane receptor protein